MNKILIGGDLVLSNDYDVDNVSDELISLFNSSSYNILNLESPVTNRGESDKIIKTGPYLKANLEVTKQVLKALSIDLCTLANNHI